MKTNTHIHLPPNFSAFESVADAVQTAAREGVRVLGASNYYDYTVYADFVDQARKAGIYPLLGLEIVTRDEALAEAGTKVNDPGNPGKMYLCGKGLTRVSGLSEAATGNLGRIQSGDAARMAKMIGQLDRVFGERGAPVGMDEDAVKAMVVRRHGVPVETVFLQERHVAQAFQEALFARIPAQERTGALSRVFGTPYTGNPKDAVAVQGEIRSHLMKAGKPGFVEEQFVTPQEAKTLILEMGGFPAYPTFADGGGTLTPFERSPEALIGNIQDLGIYAAEFIPTRNSPEVLAEYVPKMRRAGLAVSAGTEHNTLDRTPLTPTTRGGAPIPEEVARIFFEGACVIAGHQDAVRGGEAGFVDASDRPNPAYSSAEERIAAFADRGRAALEAYFE